MHKVAGSFDRYIGLTFGSRLKALLQSDSMCEMIAHCKVMSESECMAGWKREIGICAQSRDPAVREEAMDYIISACKQWNLNEIALANLDELIWQTRHQYVDVRCQASEL